MTAQIGRGLAIIVAAAAIGLLILSEGYDTGSAAVDIPVTAGDDNGSDNASDDGGDDTAADGTADGAVGDDTAADGTADGAVGDDTAADGIADDGVGDDTAADGTADGSTDAAAGDGGDGGTLRPPAEVAVLVVNGSGVSGAAARTGQTLTVQAYTVVGADNATAAATGIDAVYYNEGFQADAGAIAGIVGATPEMIQPMPSDPPALGGFAGADVIVLLGPTLATEA